MAQQQEMNFAAFLAQIEGGRFAEDVTEAMKELVVDMQRQVRAAGGKPKGGISIGIVLRINRGAVEVDASFAVKRPKAIREGTIMYAASDGALSPIDTQQTTIDFSPALQAGEVRTDVAPAERPVRMVG